MNTRRTMGAVGVGVAMVGMCLAGGGSALADAPIGSCTSSYTAYTYPQLQALLPLLPQSSFDFIDKNGDGVICFKFYNNWPNQQGHPGQAIDDKAGPH